MQRGLRQSAQRHRDRAPEALPACASRPVADACAKPDTMTPAIAVRTPANSTHASRVTDAEIAIEQRRHQQARGGGGEIGIVQSPEGQRTALASRPGQNQARKLESPMQPDAIESGAEKLSCQT